MLLRKVHIQNYRALRNAEVEFDGAGVYLLLGPNGSGKSTLVDAARWLAEGIQAANWEERLARRGGYEASISRGEEAAGIQCTFTFDTTFDHIAPPYVSPTLGGRAVDAPQLRLSDEGRGARGELRTAARDETVNTGTDILETWRALDVSRGWRFAEPLRSFDETGDHFGTKLLAPDGKNLLAFIASLQTGEPAVWARALQAMCDILPESRLQHVLTPVRPDDRVADLYVSEEGVGQILWRHGATGTKQVVFLVSLIAACPPRSVIFIEEPECNLHPLAQIRFMQFALEEARDFEKQIVISTHSLDIIERPRWKRAYVFSRTDPQVQTYDNSKISGIISQWWDVRRIVGGRVRDFLLFVEGSDDREVWKFWLRRCELEDKVTICGRGGAGAINTAQAVKTFNRLGVSPHIPFLLLLDHSAILPTDLGSWFHENEFYICTERDITAHLLMDRVALQKALGLEESAIADIVDRTQGDVKTKWALLVKQAERRDGADLKGRVAQEMAEVPGELAEAVIGRIKNALSIPPATES